MDYNYDEPGGYKVTTSALPESSGTSSSSGGTNIIWIVLFFIALAAIVGLIIWIVFLHHRDTKGKVLLFNDPNIIVNSDGVSLTGTWTPIEAGNIVTLYATLNPPKFNPDGTLSNSSATSNNAVAATGTNTVTLSNLQPGLKYYATLVARNNTTVNYQVYTQIVYMDGKTPVAGVTTTNTDNTVTSVTNTFAIEDIIQVGKLQLSTDNTTVIFNQKPSEAASLWYVDANTSYIKNSTGDYCLYSNNGVLSAITCTEIPTQKIDAAWSYNKGKYANQWCLTSTTNNSTPTCMVRGPISSSSGTASVAVTTSYAVGDAWANAYENK